VSIEGNSQLKTSRRLLRGRRKEALHQMFRWEKPSSEQKKGRKERADGILPRSGKRGFRPHHRPRGNP